MTFEEDFPSFYEDKTLDVDFQITPYNVGIIYISEKDIKQRCLDKKKVRIALWKHLKDVKGCYYDELMCELGL